MAKDKTPKPDSPAATPGADSAAAAAGTQPSQVGAGTQPAGGSSPPAGSAPGAAKKAARKPKLHPKAAAAEIPAAVLTAACSDTEFTDVLSARQYPDRWVLVLMSAHHVRKVEVPNAP